MAFALFPLTIAAQTPDQALLTALCHDNHFEDPAGHCKSLASREDFTIEAILAAYGEIISSDADDESVFYLTDPGDTPVGAIPMRQITAPGNATARDDADDESVFYLTDPGDTPVGAIPMRQITAPGNATARDDDPMSLSRSPSFKRYSVRCRAK